MDYLKNKRILENNLKVANFNIDVYIEEFNAMLGSVFSLLADNDVAKLTESQFPYLNYRNVLNTISAYQNDLEDARDFGEKYLYSNNIIRSLTNCAESRKNVKVAFKIIEEHIEESLDEREKTCLKRLHSELKNSCNALLMSVIEICERLNVDMSNFELECF